MIRTLRILVPAVATLLVAHTATHAESRTVTAFHAVESHGSFEVDIRPGPTHVEVTGDPDAVANVTTEVRSGQLVLGTRPGATHTSPRASASAGAVKISITTPTLDALTLEGSGTLAATGIATTSFAVALAGSGNIVLVGKVETAAYELAGSGAIRGKNLATRSTTLSMHGSGRVELAAIDALAVSLAGSGSVDVYDHPRSVTKSVAGSGRLEIH